MPYLILTGAVARNVFPGPAQTVPQLYGSGCQDYRRADSAYCSGYSFLIMIFLRFSLALDRVDLEDPTEMPRCLAISSWENPSITNKLNTVRYAGESSLIQALSSLWDILSSPVSVVSWISSCLSWMTCPFKKDEAFLR